MNYPLISEYTEAILLAEDNFNELTNLRPVLDNVGRPVISSGNFAVVYKMRDIEIGKFYAVKCFTRDQEGREEAYEKISDYLQQFSCEFLVDIKYYPRELYVDNNQSVDAEFPILVMDWIDGVGLEEYILINADNHDKLLSLSSKFIKLISELLSKHFAHGDLKPDNIIIDSEDNIKLIDYDGMFVPSMEGQISPELGTPKFQFPNRKPEDFNEYIDDYGTLYLALILRLIAISDETYESLSQLDIPNLLKVVAEYIEDKILSKLLSAFLLAYSRGFIEREVLSVCLYNDDRYDRKKELTYFSRAMKGDTNAMIVLGHTYSGGSFTPKNPSKAIDWYNLARAMGNINAACGVCRHYYRFENDFYGLTMSENLIHKGLLRSKNDFSFCREGEENFIKNKEYALQYFTKAAELNFAPAIYWLANKQTRHSEKVRMYEKSANMGFDRSLYSLGDIYWKGDITPKDIRKAIFYHRKAAESGFKNSQYIIGLSYIYGWGDYIKSTSEAIKWLKLAAEQMHEEAICELAKLYIFDNNVPHDVEYALHLLNSIITDDSPNGDALYLMGYCYTTGTGVNKDLSIAAKHFSRCIKCGNGRNSNSEIFLDMILRLTNIKDDTYLRDTEELGFPGITNTGKYSEDGKRFLCYRGTCGESYEVKEGTIVLCNDSFNDLYDESDGHYLEYLVLPESLRRIGNNVFCASINQIDSKSKCFIVKDKLLLSRDEKILYRYFGNDKRIEIPSTVTYIKGGAFSELDIHEIRIPNSVRYIGSNPFAGFTHRFHRDSNIKVISNSQFVIVEDNQLYSTNYNTLVACWSDMNTVYIKNGCIRIGENAFCDSSVKIIHLPSSILSIHEMAFYGHKIDNLTFIVEPNQKERIHELMPKYLKDTNRITIKSISDYMNEYQYYSTLC